MVGWPWVGQALALTIAIERRWYKMPWTNGTGACICNDAGTHPNHWQQSVNYWKSFTKLVRGPAMAMTQALIQTTGSNLRIIGNPLPMVRGPAMAMTQALIQTTGSNLRIIGNPLPMVRGPAMAMKQALIQTTGSNL